MKVDSSLLENLIRVAKEAGEEILKFYGKSEDQNIEIKGDDSPVTLADIRASNLIERELKKLYPEIPLLSEESDEETFKQRLEWETFFLVDPLDGTKEFIRNSDEFTVNIALIEKGQSIAGVVYLPVQKVTYYGSIEESFVQKAGKSERLPIEPYGEGCMRIVSSKSHPNQETEDYIENLRSRFSVESMAFGSSLKICKVAEGLADLNPRLGGTSEWDIAAGHAVVRGAGGDILLFGSKDRVTYNKECLRNPWYEVRRKEIMDLNLKS